jgi:dihydroxyacetone kinase-like predicted kinase
VVSVARAMAAAAGSAPDLGSQLRAVVVAGAAAVRRTPEQLPVLARAGVVDAGGHGLVVILDALARAVTGERGSTAPPARAARTTQALDGSREAGRVAYAYEVQYLLDAPEAAVRTLRTDLAGFADSVAVVGTGEGVWNVHAHVNDVGAAIEAGIQAGRPHRITVVRFAADADADGGGGDVLGPALVAVAPGEGLAHLFAAEGVHVVGGSAEHPPSVEDVLSAILATGARDIVLLPNASQVTGVAEAAAQRSRAGGSRVAVIPTRSPVQGLAAVAVHDRSGRFDDDVVAMAEAAAATRFAEITIAGRQALTAVGICQAGDVLGLIDGEVVEVGRGLVSVAFALVDRLLGVGVELMTVLVGSTAVTGIGALIAEHVRDRSAFTEVVVYAAEQPDHPLIIGAE